MPKSSAHSVSVCLPSNTLQLILQLLFAKLKAQKKDVSDCGQTFKCPHAGGLMQTLNTNVWGNIPLPLKV